MEARLGSCDTREFIMVPARELLYGGEGVGSDGGVQSYGGEWCKEQMGELWSLG